MDDYTSTSRVELVEGWQQYVTSFADWKSFITLTSDKINTRDQFEHKFRYLVRILNRDLFGNNYTRIVGHSYFSYALGLEWQKRGAVHFHVLVDRVVHFDAIHRAWQSMAGWAYIKPVHDAEGVAGYISKYVAKGADLELYKAAKVKEPSFKPEWYDRSIIQNALVEIANIKN